MDEISDDDCPVAGRFRRALTDAEMATVLGLIKAKSAEAGFMALWDILLTEARGLTVDQAYETGLRYQVSEYAITSEQCQTISRAMLETGKGRRLRMKQIGMMWLNKGPANFDPDEAAVDAAADRFAGNLDLTRNPEVPDRPPGEACRTKARPPQ